MPKAEQVGYRNPPAHSRFLEGQSGSPKSRPVRLIKSLAGALAGALLLGIGRAR